MGRSRPNNKKGGKKGRPSVAGQARKDTNASIIAAQQQATKMGWNNPLPRLSTDTPQELAENRDRTRGFLDTAGQRSAEQSAALADMQRNTGRSDEMGRQLNRLEGGLGGLNADENRGLREQGLQSIMSDDETQRQQFMRGAGGRVGGAAFAANLANMGRANQQNKRDLERDIMLKNIDIQDRRRGQYGEALTGAEAAEAARRTGYQGALSGQEKQEFDQKGTAMDKFTAAGKDISDLRDRREADNVNLSLDEQSNRINAVTGLAGLYTGATAAAGSNKVLSDQIAKTPSRSRTNVQPNPAAGGGTATNGATTNRRRPVGNQQRRMRR